jgi:hypothetical protein
MDLIAESQPLHSRFKSVTDEIMKNSLRFIRLHAHTQKTLGHFCPSLISNTPALRKFNEAPRSKLRGITELNFEDFSEAEANPVASYGESQVEKLLSICTEITHVVTLL